MWNVRPGDKVTLIEALHHSCYTKALKQGWTIPSLGEVYTVRECLVGWTGKEEAIGIRLVEIRNAPKRLEVGANQVDFVEVSFVLSKFRPVISHKGMETLRSLLTNPKLLRETNPLDVRKVKVG